MSATRKTNPTKAKAKAKAKGGAAPPIPPELFWREFYDDVATFAWLPALRFALGADGAPGRCSRRGCRLSGKCHLAGDGGELACGAGLPDETMVAAVNHVLFAIMVLRFVLEDLQGLKPPKEAVDHRLSDYFRAQIDLICDP
jgi:hypothetical protein